MNYTITKEGNWGIITPTPEGILAKTLDKYMSYEVSGKYYLANPSWAIKHLYSIKRGVFPAGLIYIAKAIFKKYCKVKECTYTITNYPTNTLTYDTNSLSTSLRYYQKEGIQKLLEHHGGTIILPTASGKTIMMIEYVKLLNLKTLIITPTVEIQRQWNKELQKSNMSNVAVLTFQNTDLKVKNKKRKISIDKILTNKKYISSFGLICIDECHKASADSIFNICMHASTDAILCGVTASAKREDNAQLKVFGALGPIIYSKERKELINEGFIANATVYYVKTKFLTNGKYKKYGVVYGEEVVNNEYRNTQIANIALAEANNSRRVLILISILDHGRILLDKLKPILGDEIIYMNGKSKERDVDLSKFKVIIASSILDQGFDLPTLDTLILAGSGKSEVQVTQRAGRVLRIKPDGREAKIYDFMDVGVKYLSKQYIRRRELLSKDFSIIELDLAQSLLSV